MASLLLSRWLWLLLWVLAVGYFAWEVFGWAVEHFMQWAVEAL